MNRKRITYGTKLPVYVSQAELDDIRELTFVDTDLVSHAIVEGKKLCVDLMCGVNMCHEPHLLTSNRNIK